MQPKKKQAWLCGAIDGLLTLALGLLTIFPNFLAILNGKRQVLLLIFFSAFRTPSILVSDKWHFVLFLIFPVCVLVAWRGSKNASRLLSADRSWVRAPMEGFVAGAILVFVCQSYGILTELLAAGRPWMFALPYILFWVLLLGAIGAAIGFGLSLFNRFLIRTLFRQRSPAV